MLLRRYKNRQVYAKSQNTVKEVTPVTNTKEKENILPDETPADSTKYTKSDINRMSKSELINLADSAGISNATERTGAELKTLLIQNYNL